MKMTWTKLDGCAYKQHPFMCQSTVKEFVFYTFNLLCHLCLGLCEVSVYIPIRALEKFLIRCGCLLLFTGFLFKYENMEIVSIGYNTPWRDLVGIHS